MSLDGVEKYYNIGGHWIKDDKVVEWLTPRYLMGTGCTLRDYHYSLKEAVEHWRYNHYSYLREWTHVPIDCCTLQTRWSVDYDEHMRRGAMANRRRAYKAEQECKLKAAPSWMQDAVQAIKEGQKSVHVVSKGSAYIDMNGLHELLRDQGWPASLNHRPQRILCGQTQITFWNHKDHEIEARGWRVDCVILTAHLSGKQLEGIVKGLIART